MKILICMFTLTIVGCQFMHPVAWKCTNNRPNGFIQDGKLVVDWMQYSGVQGMSPDELKEYIDMIGSVHLKIEKKTDSIYFLINGGCPSERYTFNDSNQLVKSETLNFKGYWHYYEGKLPTRKEYEDYLIRKKENIKKNRSRNESDQP